VLKCIQNGKNLIIELKKAIPNRAESQIRAHHQKMLKKYGSIKEIIRIVGREENNQLTTISQKLDTNINNFSTVIDDLEKSLNKKKIKYKK
jgi:hypothetical protein